MPPQNYSLSVYLVKQLTAVALLQKLRAKGIRNPDHSRALSEGRVVAHPIAGVAVGVGLGVTDGVAEGVGLGAAEGIADGVGETTAITGTLG